MVYMEMFKRFIGLVVCSIVEDEDGGVTVDLEPDTESLPVPVKEKPEENPLPGEVKPAVIESDEEEVPVVDDEGVSYYNRTRELQRKNEELQRKIEERQPAYQQPYQQPYQPVQPVHDPYKKFRDAGYDDGQIQMISELIAANQEAYAKPYLDNFAYLNTRAAKAELLSDPELGDLFKKHGKKYEAEINQLINASTPQQRMHPDIYKAAFRQILGTHVTELNTSAEVEGQKEGAKSRRIVGQGNPSNTGKSPATGRGVRLTAEEKEVADKIWSNDPKRYERYAKSREKTKKLNAVEA